MGLKCELLKSFPAQIEQLVRWGDMDAFSHVNNIMYFRYFEEARIEYLAQLGIHFNKAPKIGPVLGEISCKFRLPVTFPDTLTCAVKTIDIKEDRITVEHVIYSEKLDGIVARGTGVMVWYNHKTLKKVSICSSVIENIKRMDLNL